MIDVVLCASGADEVQLVSLISAELSQQVRVVRRCADLAEALGVTESGIGDVVIVDVDVNGLERSTVAVFHTHGIPVVALESDRSRRSSAELGGLVSLKASMDSDAIYTVILEAVANAQEPAGIESWEEEPDADEERGLHVCVWGPMGGPGRTFVATNLGWLWARRGHGTLLIDADTQGPCISQVLGILDEVPGLVASCRLAMKGALQAEALDSVAPVVADGLQLLSGIGVPARWSEVDVGALRRVLREARRTHDLVVTDVGATLEGGEVGSIGPERYGATHAALHDADIVIAVVSADPVSITRFLRDADRLRELSSAPLIVIVNRVSKAASFSQIERSLRTRVDVADVLSVPLDTAAVARAAWDGQLVCETAPRSESSRAFDAIARDLVSRYVTARQAT